MSDQKGCRYFDPVSQKLYVSHHVVFLEHIPFFLISSSSHNMTKFDLIHIDPFIIDNDVDPPSVSHAPVSTTDSVSCRISLIAQKIMVF